MVSMLPSSVVVCGFEPPSGKTKDYEIGICCFSAKHAILRRTSKDWLAWNQDNVSVYICSYYNPKMSDSESMKEFETSLQRAAAKNPCLLIGGDLNLPGWNWINKTLHSGTQHAQQHYYFSDILDDHGLTQLVQEPTRNKNTLDLLITNYPSKILRIDVTPGISDHDIVYTEMNMNSAINTQKPRKIPIYRKSKSDSMKEDVSNLHRKIQ